MSNNIVVEHVSVKRRACVRVFLLLIVSVLVEVRACVGTVKHVYVCFGTSTFIVFVKHTKHFFLLFECFNDSAIRLGTLSIGSTEHFM